MRIGPLEIRWRRPVEIIRSPVMNEAALNRAFAKEENNPMLMAIQQVLDDAERDANELAAAELHKNNPLIVAGYAGAAQQCRDLMAGIQRRRNEGLKALKSIPVVRRKVTSDG